MSGIGSEGITLKRWTAAIALAAVAALILVAFLIGPGQGAKVASATDRLASLKVGQWVQIKGGLRADSTSRCDELKIMTGDFLDDDWALKGFIQALDAAKQEFTVNGIGVQVTEGTRFDSQVRTFQAFSDLRMGQLVEVEGTYLKSGKFLANEADDESDDLARRPWTRGQIMIVGRIERVDSRKHLISAMGMVFEVTETTRLRSAIE